MENMPTVLNPEHLSYHKKLVDDLKNAQEAEVRARAAAFTAIQAGQAANQALQGWIDHLTTIYNLKPNDGIDADGNIHYTDIGWAIEAQARARMEAEGSPLIDPSAHPVEVVPLDSDIIADGDEAAWEDTHPEEDYADPAPPSSPPPSVVTPAPMPPPQVPLQAQVQANPPVTLPDPPQPPPKKAAGKKNQPHHMPTI
jgi:hypothetical protein